MPGLHKYLDLDVLLKSKIFQDIILQKSKQKALFLVYIVQGCRFLFLYEVVRGTSGKLADARILKSPINFEVFESKVQFDIHSDSNREFETALEYDNTFISLISSEPSKIVENVLHSTCWVAP